MEKTWQTDPNFTIATTSSYLVMGQSVMMELKNHMVSHAAWSVVGSSNGTVFEYQAEVGFPILKDDVGLSNGTLTNMEFGDTLGASPGGISTRSLIFDGVNESVSMEDNFNFTESDTYTFSLWFKTTVSDQGFLSKMGGADGYPGYALEMGTLGDIFFHLVTNYEGGSQGTATTVATGFNDGQWHHLAVSYSGTGSIAGVSIRVDNVSQALNTSGTFTTISPGGNFLLGKGRVSSSYYEGNLAEVAIYDKVLSPTELLHIYNSGAPQDLKTLSSSTDLLSWWRPELTGTTGGSYGGDSTGSFDVWASITDIPRQVNGSGPGWCLLKSPSSSKGTFYALIAMEGTGDSSSNGFTWYSNRNWVPYATSQELYLPTRAPGAAVHGRSRYTFFTMFGGTYTTRGYFSGAVEDGSFIFALNLTAQTWFTGLQMFHVIDSAHPSGVMPTCSCSHSTGTASTYTTNADYFYSYHPRYASRYTGAPTDGSGTRCVATFPQFVSTRIFSTMTTVNYASEIDAFPLFLLAEDDTSAQEMGRSTFVGRIPDVYSAPEGLNEADTMPIASPEYFKFGGWLLPGDTIPVLGP